MSIFNTVRDNVNTYFSDWIKINDNKSIWTIEDFTYQTGVQEILTFPHCWQCVTVNNCWFKNEESKKPEEYPNSSLNQDLYHPNCHCKKHPINTPTINDIELIMLEGKIDFFFKDKLDWYYSWGYTDADKEEFISIIIQLVKESFGKGNYEFEKHTKFGFQINVFIALPGKNKKLGKIYNTWSCYMIFPNGKLKLNTVIGGK